MKKIIEYLRRRKRAFLIGSIGICAVLVLFGAFYYSQLHVSETVVRRYMKQASLKLNDAEIKMLSKNLSKEINDKIQAAEADGISEEEMRSILQAVNKQLSHATYELSAGEITKISNEILKEVVSNYIPDQDQYKDMIDELSAELSELEKNSYSKEQIRKIASELDLTEEDVIEIMNEAILTDGALSDLADELDISVEELTKLIAENRKYTDSLYVQLSAFLDLEPAELKQLMETVQNSSKRYTYLANKLGVTEEKLYAEIAKCKALSDEEIAGIAEKLNLSSSEFQKKLDDNLQVTEEKLESLAYGMNIDLAKMEQLISENQILMEQSIKELEDISEANLNTALSKISSIVGALPDGTTIAELFDGVDTDITGVKTDLQATSGSLLNAKTELDEIKEKMAMKAELRYSNADGVPTIILSGVVEE